MRTLINKVINALKKMNAGNPGACNPMDSCCYPYQWNKTGHSITPSGK